MVLISINGGFIFGVTLGVCSLYIFELSKGKDFKKRSKMSVFQCVDQKGKKESKDYYSI